MVGWSAGTAWSPKTCTICDKTYDINPKESRLFGHVGMYREFQNKEFLQTIIFLQYTQI